MVSQSVHGLVSLGLPVFLTRATSSRTTNRILVYSEVNYTLK